MSPTVQELRNEIRVAVGRFEREFDASFTKEDLAAIANAAGHEVSGKPFPPKPEMRAGIRQRLEMAAGDGNTDGGAFVKAELEAIADALGTTDR